MNKDFLKPDNMKLLGFDCTKNEHPYYIYKNDGTKHRNKDYNSQFPEPRGKVIVACNLDYNPDMPFVGIEQDGGSRNVYHGICPSEEFLETLLNNVR